jgi:UDPglucose 6-dehydrogenase
MRTSIVGAGHVGLVMAGCLAEHGHDVVCVDIDEALIGTLRTGGVPIHEPGLAELLTRHSGDRVRFTTSIADAVESTDITMITVGTPLRDDAIDLRQVLDAASAVGAVLRTKARSHVLAVKSTVVPGTTDGAVRAAVEASSGRTVGEGFGLSANPEFLTEGRAVADVLNPDRIVIGGNDEVTIDTVARLYSGFLGVPIIRTGNTAAELIKYTSNALLATMISLSNEIADLCVALGDVDVRDVMHAVHASRYLTTGPPDGRVAAAITSFLEAGCGFGGSCLPKDVRSLIRAASDLGVETRLLAAVMAVNDDRADRVVDGIRRAHGGLEGVAVTVLGLAFKEETDDIRESPAIPVIARLLDQGAEVTVYDPVATERARPILEGTTVRFADNLEDAVRDAAVAVIATRWKEFLALPEVLDRLGQTPLVFDGRRLLEPRSVDRYAGVGRGTRLVPSTEAGGLG